MIENKETIERKEGIEVKTSIDINIKNIKDEENGINATIVTENITQEINTVTLANINNNNDEKNKELLGSSENSITQLEQLLSKDEQTNSDTTPLIITSSPPPTTTTTTTTIMNNNENEEDDNSLKQLTKKEILGVLLVDSFSNFYIQDSILFPQHQTVGVGGEEKMTDTIVNDDINTISPTTIIGNGYKDNEVTSFLVNAFHYLSIPMTVLNYLLLTNKQSISSSTVSTSTSKQISKVSSFSSIPSLLHTSPTLSTSTSSNNLLHVVDSSNYEISPPSLSPLLSPQQTTITSSSTLTTTTLPIAKQQQQQKENILPNKVDKNIIMELEMLYDHHYSMEIFEYSKKISQAQNDIDTKSKLYFQYLSDLTKRSLAICPPKYSDLITSSPSSNQFYTTIRESVEFFLIQNLFHHLFQIDYDLDYQFSKRVESLKFIELSHLGVNNNNGGGNQFNKELCTTLFKLNVYQTPVDKQRCLARTLVKLLKINGGEELLLPNLVYLILVSNPPNIYSNYKFLEKFIDHETQNPIYEYSFLLFSMAIQFIEKLDHNHLSIDPLYFQSKLFEYNQKNNVTTTTTTTSTNQTTTTTTTIINNNDNSNNNLDISNNNLSIQFSNLLINEPSDIDNNNNNNYELNNFLTDNENRFKIFKENNRIQTMIELCKNQITDNEIEELLLKFISISLIKENPSYHSLIRYSLKRFFIYYLGIDKNVFLSTEMHTIGALQDDNQTNGTQSDLLPDGSLVNANNNSSGKDRAIKTAKIAGAAVTGAVLVGMTGGLAAPFIGMMLNFVGAGSIVAGISGATGLSSATMLSVIFGAAGAKVSAGAMISATSGIKDYQIHKIKSQTSLHAIIGVYGICNDLTGVSDYYQTKSVWDRVIRSVTDDYGDIFIVEWEKEVMLKLKQLVSEYQGTIVQGIVRSAATNIISQSLASALVPLSVLKAASVLDNPWSLLKDRSEKAGKVLAQQIVDGYFGNRPLTLVSTSMGSRMVFYALEELYNLSLTNPKIYSLIESVVFIGSPITSDQKRWSKILKLVSGRLVNCYTPNDLLLKYVCRSINCLSDGILPAAGVAPIHIPCSSLVIENVDLSNLVKSHLDYEKEEILCKILQHVDINNIKYCLPKISPLYSGKVYDI
ncbi:hypothetical protein RB653_003201 [Dictyostelium firmibasis]|uniref:VPS9 domain-containing protein n=1 Tax=Dictyostelium firmibasis TaxID=79012 RepID=A0AAN7TXY4_9MYCE